MSDDGQRDTRTQTHAGSSNTTRRPASFNGHAGGSFGSFPPTAAGSSGYNSSQLQPKTPSRAGSRPGAAIVTRSPQPNLFARTSPMPNIFGRRPAASSSNANAIASVPSTASNSPAAGAASNPGAKIFDGSSPTPNLFGRATTPPTGNGRNALFLPSSQPNSPAGPTGIYGRAPRNVDQEMPDTDVESWDVWS
ncbi:hypothetical protein CC86DRAFT_408849 [Ophiobolus disseminans]|uniref:Uncharacterized protein n=1 Tax=Ophiobolus disseminans TaxID=1469910 RepID=A0A6A6ZT97_9PLEO|nr:hypothetical protein CC86DRAFT_408849 [Ophiobolus disseminans]